MEPFKDLAILIFITVVVYLGVEQLIERGMKSESFFLKAIIKTAALLLIALLVFVALPYYSGMFFWCRLHLSLYTLWSITFCNFFRNPPSYLQRCYREEKNVIIILLITVIALSIGLLTKVYFKVDTLFDDKPPSPKITLGSTYINVKLASYCWTGGCADTIGPPALLNGVKPTKVSPNKELSIVFDYHPQPTGIFIERQVDDKWVGGQVSKGLSIHCNNSCLSPWAICKKGFFV